MGRFFCLSISSALLCGAAPVFATDAGAGAATETDDQREIVVTGERQKSAADATSTATKTNTDIKDIPQALTIVSEKQIADQQLRSVADLLNFVPGASYGSGEGNRDQIVLRGNSQHRRFLRRRRARRRSIFPRLLQRRPRRGAQGPERDDLRPRRRRRNRQPRAQAPELQPPRAASPLRATAGADAA